MEVANDWNRWRLEFIRGKTIVAYCFLINIILISAMFILNRNYFMLGALFILIASNIGGLVDTTAHLFVAGYTKGLSADTGKKFLKDFIDGRTHVLYGQVVGFVVSIILIVMFIMLGGESIVFAIFVLFAQIIIMQEIIWSRYYH